MTDLSTIIRARFAEAADTERRLPFAKTRPNGYGSSMPTYLHDFADLVGWGKERLAEERQMATRRLPPAADAISRHDECLRWTAMISPKVGVAEDYRRALWARAFAFVGGKPFRVWCRAAGIAHVTGYRRSDAAVDLLSSIFRKSSVSVTSPADEWVLRIEAADDTNSGIVGVRTGRDRTRWSAADAEPAATEDERFQRLAEAQRRRREKLGCAA